VTIHVTPIPSTIALTTPAFSLGSTNEAGASTGAVASDSTLLVFDSTLPDAITFGQSGATGTAAVASHRDHAHAMTDDPSKLILIGTAEASTSATLDITGLDSTYASYLITLSDMTPSSDYSTAYFRLGDSGGIDSGATDYAYHNGDNSPSAITYDAHVSTGANRITLGENGIDSAAGGGLQASLWLNRPGDSTMKPLISGTWNGVEGGGLFEGGIVLGAMNSVIDVDRVQFRFSSGTVISGRMSVFGLKHD